MSQVYLDPFELMFFVSKYNIVELLHPATAIYIQDKRSSDNNKDHSRQEEMEKKKLLKIQNFCEFLIHEKPQLLVDVLW